MLLVPRALDCLPQLLDAGAVGLGLRFCAEMANPFVRVGCAAAAVVCSALLLPAPLACAALPASLFFSLSLAALLLSSRPPTDPNPQPSPPKTPHEPHPKR